MNSIFLSNKQIKENLDIKNLKSQVVSMKLEIITVLVLKDQNKTVKIQNQSRILKIVYK